MYLISRLTEICELAAKWRWRDELFGGYDYYSWLLKAQYLRKFVPGPIRACIARATSAFFLPVFATATSPWDFWEVCQIVSLTMYISIAPAGTGYSASRKGCYQYLRT